MGRGEVWASSCCGVTLVPRRWVLHSSSSYHLLHVYVYVSKWPETIFHKYSALPLPKGVFNSLLSDTFPFHFCMRSLLVLFPEGGR